MLTEKEQMLITQLNNEGEPASMAEQPMLFRGFLYGDFGAGKTDLAAQICKALGGTNCLVYADSAWTTVLKYPDIAANTYKYPFGGFSQIKTILKARQEGIEPYCRFNNLIWDTCSVSCDIVLRNLVEKYKGSFPREQAHLGQAKDILEVWPHYRLLERLLIEVIETISKTDMNVIYTAHHRFPNEQDQKQQKLSIRPSMPEAAYKVIARESNLIGYVHKNTSGGQRYIQLSGTVTETAKCQIPGIEEKTYPVEDIPKLLTEWKNSNA
jgi:hypothetical protein